MAGLNSQQLKDIISETTVPLIKQFVGTQLADVVREQVQASLAAAARPAQPVVAALTGGAEGEHMRGGTHTAEQLGVGMKWARYVRALAAGKNDKEKAARIAKAWGYHDVADAIDQSIAKAMSAGDPTAGGFLVPTQFSTDVIELLRASGVIRSLNPVNMPMPTGSIKVPRITQGVTATYIGENTNIGKSEVQTGQLTLTWKKLAVLVPVSNDLIRYASPAADGIVRDDSVRSMATREDLAFLRDDGMDGKPRGIKNWINGANKFTAASPSLANVTIDLGKLMQAIMDANITLILQQGATGGVDSRPGWIFAPRMWRYLTTLQTTTGAYAFREEMLRGTLWGFPYRVTTQCENGTVYFGCFAHAVIGEAQQIMVDASQEAAYHDGSNVIAAYSQDQTVIRLIAEHDFALRHDRAFSLLEGGTWGA